MKLGPISLVCTVLACALAAYGEPASAQLLTGPPADPQYKYSTPMPPGIASPDQVETRLGTLHFSSGFPDKATAQKIYDNLDFQHAVQAYLLAIPAVSQAANHNAMLALGPANTTVADLGTARGFADGGAHLQRQHCLYMVLARSPQWPAGHRSAADGVRHRRRHVVPLDR